MSKRRDNDKAAYFALLHDKAMRRDKYASRNWAPGPNWAVTDRVHARDYIAKARKASAAIRLEESIYDDE